MRKRKALPETVTIQGFTFTLPLIDWNAEHEHLMAIDWMGFPDLTDLLTDLSGLTDLLDNPFDNYASTDERPQRRASRAWGVAMVAAGDDQMA